MQQKRLINWFFSFFLIIVGGVQPLPKPKQTLIKVFQIWLYFFIYLFLFTIVQLPAVTWPNLLGITYKLKLHGVVVRWKVTGDTWHTDMEKYNVFTQARFEPKLFYPKKCIKLKKKIYTISLRWFFIKSLQKQVGSLV